MPVGYRRTSTVPQFIVTEHAPILDVPAVDHRRRRRRKRWQEVVISLERAFVEANCLFPELPLLLGECVVHVLDHLGVELDHPLGEFWIAYFGSDERSFGRFVLGEGGTDF